MKKTIASIRWLVTYLIILVVLTVSLSLSVFTLIYGINMKSLEPLITGIVMLVMEIPISALILFWLNRRACLVWIDGNCLKSRGLLFGFQRSIYRRDVEAIGITPNGKKIYVISPAMQRDMHGDIFLPNTDDNIVTLKNFWKADIYSQCECEKCVRLGEKKVLESPEEYLAAIDNIKILLNNGEYELISGSCNINKIIDENGAWQDDYICHFIKCKKCGTLFGYSVDTYHGLGKVIKRSTFDCLRFRENIY